MFRSHTLTAALLLAVTAGLRADGCKFRLDGRFVPEREQRALVEWADGVETLYVATLSDPTDTGTVWVVPVRSAARAVRAEPVDRFPAVVYYETLKSRAERRLEDMVAITGLLDSGGLCCMVAVGGCDDKKSAGKAAEVSRVEKLGMVVTVVTAESRTALEEYLAAQGVNPAAADLSSLSAYFGRTEYTFVCGWVARSDELASATGLRVVFPSPTLWFPLRPTRAYRHPVQTVVYARGFVRPAAGCDLPGLHCGYIFGKVEERGVRQSFVPSREDVMYGLPPGTPLDEMTRVTLTADPQDWDRDPELVPGTTPAGTAARAVTGWAGELALGWSFLLGCALGLLLPILTVPRGERQAIDWLLGGLTGAAIAFSLWACVLAFAFWRWVRFSGRPKRPVCYVALPALAAAHFGIVFGVCRALLVWIRAGA